MKKQNKNKQENFILRSLVGSLFCLLTLGVCAVLFAFIIKNRPDTDSLSAVAALFSSCLSSAVGSFVACRGSGDCIRNAVISSVLPILTVLVSSMIIKDNETSAAVCLFVFPLTSILTALIYKRKRSRKNKALRKALRRS